MCLKGYLEAVVDESPFDVVLIAAAAAAATAARPGLTDGFIQLL